MSIQHSRTNDFNPSQYENAVFVSYKWGGEGEEIVNQIEEVLQARGIKLIRDKRDLGFRSSIRKFMERMGRGTCVIVVINDGYLRSKHCMFELMEIAEAEQFHDRVFPVVLGDADIFDPIKIIAYVKHWEEKKAELTEAVKAVDQANLQGIRDEIDLYDRIRDEISGLISTLNDMNTLTPEIHKEGDYAILAKAIEERIESKDSVQQETIRDRRLDAAMPKECQVGHMTELRALVALPDSQGLKAYLPDYTISRELIDRGDVAATGTPINFPDDPNTGRLLPAYLYVKIDAPNFRTNQRVQQLLVPPDKDSGMLTFFLSPKKPQSIGRVSVTLYQDKDCLIALGSVTLTTKVNVQEEVRSEHFWQLRTLSLIVAGSKPPTLDLNDDNNRPPSPRARKRLSVGLQVAILGAIATILAAIINIYPTLSAVTTNTPVPPSPTPSCMNDVEPLVKFHILKNEQEIITINPKEVYHMQPNSTIEVQLGITAANDVVLATPQCTWTNTGTGTDGEFLQKAGCTVVYQSGHTRVEDAISLQVSQPSCPGLFSYAFFILPENLEEVP